jgi:hypothetical protein
MNKDSAPIVVFLLFFMEVIQLLVAETNSYYNKYIDILDSDMTVQETYIFLATIIQMGHNLNIDGQHLEQIYIKL